MTELVKHLNFSFKRKLPIIHQTEVTECGLACLAMIANYYGNRTDILALRKYFSVSLKGCRLQDLVDIGTKLHLSSRALKVELEGLKQLRTPCVLHWNLDHFVVLKKVQGNSVIIHDPALGIIKYKLTEASKYFTGIVLELTPTIDFEKKQDKTKLHLTDLCSSVTGLTLPLVQILLISLAIEIIAILSPLFMQLVMDDVLVAKDMPLLYILALGFALLTIISVATSYLRSTIILFLSNVLNIQFVTNLTRHLFRLPLEFFQKRHMGDIVSRFGSITSIQVKISTDFVEGIVDGVMVIITLVMMLIYSTFLTTIVFAALLLYIAIRISLYSTFRRTNQESLIAAAKENSIFMEGIRAILPIKIFGKEAQRESIWQNCYVDRLNASIRPSKLALVYRFFQGISSGLEYIIIIMIGAKLVMQNSISIGMLMAYFAYRQQFVDKAQSLINKVFDYKLISLELERVADIALSEPEPGIDDNIKIIRPLQGGIRVENLAFRYSEQDHYVFKNINFEIKPGESIAIIGPSGCGKTTLMKILMRLLTQTHGEIFVDNIDIKRFGLRGYRTQIAAVMQEDTLLSGSIADNISFFDHNQDINRIYTCAELSAIHNDILGMPMEYHSLVGDMGTALSGGQKQRVLLARALYSQPKILFLDEATSHLDFATERTINQHIKELGITRVIIAHRQETIQTADRVINLGQLIETAR